MPHEDVESLKVEGQRVRNAHPQRKALLLLSDLKTFDSLLPHLSVSVFQHFSISASTPFDSLPLPSAFRFSQTLDFRLVSVRHRANVLS